MKRAKHQTPSAKSDVPQYPKDNGKPALSGSVAPLINENPAVPSSRIPFGDRREVT